MSARSIIDDDLLSAWLDGEVDDVQRAEVDAALRDHPELAARVAQWAADRDAIAARFDPTMGEPVPTRLAQIVWMRGHQVARPATRWMAVAATFLLGGIVGAVAAWQWSEREDVPRGATASAHAWVQRAALAHRVYVPEKRHPVEVDVTNATDAQRAGQEEHLQRWLTRRVDVPVKLFDLRRQGFDLVGGRLLPNDPSGPCAMLMYENTDTRQRVTVYLRRAADDAPAAFRYEVQGDVGLFYWVEGHSGYALAGALPREKLLLLAQAIYAQQPTGADAAR